MSHQQALPRLESLRGLAAIQVAVFHSLLILESTHCAHDYLPALISLFNGRSAVTLFFVLSGLVLGLSLRRSSGPLGAICLAYVVRRFFRIYPAYILATFIAIGVIYLIPAIFAPTPSEWANGILPTSVTLSTLGKNLLFINHDINPVTWTLEMEMICSMFLPICYCGSLLSPRIPWLMLMASMLFSACLPKFVSAAVLQAFLVGYSVPMTADFWRRISCHWSIAYLLTFGGGIMLLYSRSLHLPLSTITLMEATGGAVVIAALTYGVQVPLFTVLDWHFIKVAGRISYSYYLLQPLLLVFVAHLLLEPLLRVTGYAHPLLCAFALWMASSIPAFPAAWLSYEWVEKPMIRLSKSFRFHPTVPDALPRPS